LGNQAAGSKIQEKGETGKSIQNIKRWILHWAIHDNRRKEKKEGGLNSKERAHPGITFCLQKTIKKYEKRRKTLVRKRWGGTTLSQHTKKGHQKQKKDV